MSDPTPQHPIEPSSEQMAEPLNQLPESSAELLSHQQSELFDRPLQPQPRQWLQPMAESLEQQTEPVSKLLDHSDSIAETLSGQPSGQPPDRASSLTVEPFTEPSVRRSRQFAEPVAEPPSQPLPQPIDHSSQVQWAPIIYSRTYAVDFRFIVTPEDFTEEHEKVVWNYVKITTRSAEKLPDNPRWLFLRTPGRCVVGVTCMVRDLMASSKVESAEDLTKDRLGRPLYAFVGYVAKVPTPYGIPAMDLELFAEPYRTFVSQKWNEEYIDLNSNQDNAQILKSRYDIEFKSDELATPDRNSRSININLLFPRQSPEGSSHIIFWNRADGKNLWFAVSNDTALQHGDRLSLCIGNFSKRDASNSDFMNVALEEVNDRTEEPRIFPPPAAPPQPEQPPASKASSKRSAKQSSPSTQSKSNRQTAHSQEAELFSKFREVIVSSSKFGRSKIESILGEEAADQADDLARTLSKALFGDEFTNELYVDITNPDERRKRLEAAIAAKLENLRTVEQEENELRYWGREHAANRKAVEARSIREELKHIDQILEKTRQVLVKQARSRGDFLSPEFEESRPNSSYGFKEKKETVEPEQPDRPTEPQKPPKSKDPWQL